MTRNNWIIAILAAIIYNLLINNSLSVSTLGGLLNSIAYILAVMIPGAVIASFYYLIKRKGFSKVLAWAVVITAILAYFGRDVL